MKTLFWACSILLFSVLPARCEDVPVKTFPEWVALITKDAKLTSLRSVLGKPDEKETSDQGVVEYKWYGVVDSGGKNPEALRVFSLPHKDQLFIVAIYNPATKIVGEFPWAKTLAPTHPANHEGVPSRGQNPVESQPPQQPPTFARGFDTDPNPLDRRPVQHSKKSEKLSGPSQASIDARNQNIQEAQKSAQERELRKIKDKIDEIKNAQMAEIDRQLRALQKLPLTPEVNARRAKLEYERLQLGR